MKKSLVALAALAVVGAASAQSSVTLYGVLDVSMAKTSAPGLGLVNDQFQMSGANTLNNGTSRFGFRGSEDLGGGLKAGFSLEGGVNPINGAGNTSGGNLFSRAANVSLSGGFGSIRLGRGLSTSFFSIAQWELTGTSNYSAVGGQFGYIGAVYESGAVKYDSPNLSGFSFSGSVVAAGNELYGTPGNGKGKYDLSATYANGPIAASVAYNKIDGGNEGAVLGGKYDLGMVQVAASYSRRKTDAGVVLAEGYSLGASGQVGPVTLTLDVARDTEFNDTDFVLEAKYPLSKRTFLYGVFKRDGSGKTVSDVDGYAIGVRHNF